MSISINEDDPCGAAQTLREVYINLVSGQSVAKVRFRAGPNGVEREVNYAKADAAALQSIIRGFEAECAKRRGVRPRRFSVSTGGRR